VSETYREAIRWWARYLSVFALNPPWGITGKFTIGVPASVGEDVAKLLRLTPKDVVDAVGRPCLQVEIEDRVIAIEWLKPPPPQPTSNSPVTWGGKSTTEPNPLDRYFRNERGALELKKKWTPD
jgi:hypothetical protein